MPPLSVSPADGGLDSRPQSGVEHVDHYEVNAHVSVEAADIADQAFEMISEQPETEAGYGNVTTIDLAR